MFTLATGKLLFRWRGVTPVPLLAVAVLLGRPSGMTLLVGIALTVMGEAIRWWAVSHIGSVSRTRSSDVRTLIRGGPFARSRNPIYVGNFLIGIGLIGAAGVPLVACLYVVLFAVQYGFIVAWEESRLEAEHGLPYRQYKAEVPRWLGVGRSAGTGEESTALPWLVVLRSERSTLAVQLSFIGLLSLMAWLVPEPLLDLL